MELVQISLYFFSQIFPDFRIFPHGSGSTALPAGETIQYNVIFTVGRVLHLLHPGHLPDGDGLRGGARLLRLRKGGHWLQLPAKHTSSLRRDVTTCNVSLCSGDGSYTRLILPSDPKHCMQCVRRG